MITTFCPQCNNPLTFEDSHAGMQGQCDKCNAVLTVPMAAAPGTRPNYYGAPAGGNSGSNGLGIAGFVISLVSLFIFGIILGPLSVILSAVALKHPKKGLAIAGLIIGLVATIGAIIFIVYIATHPNFRIF